MKWNRYNDGQLAIDLVYVEIIIKLNMKWIYINWPFGYNCYIIIHQLLWIKWFWHIIEAGNGTFKSMQKWNNSDVMMDLYIRFDNMTPNEVYWYIKQ
jgi:hypothetical protein